MATSIYLQNSERGMTSRLSPPTFCLTKQRGRLLHCCRRCFSAGKQHTSPGGSCTVASSQLILTTQTQDQVAKKQCNLQLSLSVDTGVWRWGCKISFISEHTAGCNTENLTSEWRPLHTGRRFLFMLILYELLIGAFSSRMTISRCEKANLLLFS